MIEIILSDVLEGIVSFMRLIDICRTIMYNIKNNT